MSTHLSHSWTETQRAVAGWLADSLQKPGNARQEWSDTGIAVLALGRRFAAVRLAEELVYAVTASVDPDTVGPVLRDVLRGPVIHDPRGQRFYALVPASPSAGNLGRYATYLGLGHYIGVPRVQDTEPSEFLTSYWAVPMLRRGDLCDPIRLADMLAAGSDALTDGDGSWTPPPTAPVKPCTPERAVTVTRKGPGRYGMEMDVVDGKHRSPIGDDGHQPNRPVPPPPPPPPAPDKK
ncbi:hypothetical protein ACWCPS_35200 [Streptomyces mauvecolor]